jgi:hypothetical protein
VYILAAVARQAVIAELFTLLDSGSSHGLVSRHGGGKFFINSQGEEVCQERVTLLIQWAMSYFATQV